MPTSSMLRSDLAALVLAAFCGAGCNTLLDSGRYHAIGGGDSGEGFVDGGGPGEDSAPDAAMAEADASTCDVDLSTQCYPCAATTPSQILAACTSAACVPFDDIVRVPLMGPDGALPPLPGTSN
jgi:hypothetical protein